MLYKLYINSVYHNIFLNQFQYFKEFNEAPESLEI